MRTLPRSISATLLLILTLALSGCVVTPDGRIILTTPPAVPVPEQQQMPTATPAAPAADDADTEETAPSSLDATVNTRSLRVRRGPNTDAPIVAGLREADIVTVVGRTADGAWLQIVVPDVETLGWVSSEFLTLEADASVLPIPEDVAEEQTDAADETADETADEAAEETAEETADEAAEETVDETADEAAAVAPQIDIVETARAIDEFSTLVAAIDAAVLGDVLQSQGPFTVFAPTNDAFAALPTETLDALLADPAGDLSQILLYHVVPGRIMSADVSDGQQVESFQDETLTIGVDGETITVNGASVILTDVEASNGVIHVIDAVLVPSVVDLTAQPAAVDEPAADAAPSVTVADQPIADGAVTVAEVVATEAGWIVIHAANGDGGIGPVIGQTAVNAGANSDVVVAIDSAGATDTLYAMLHVDAGEAGIYEFPGADVPVIGDGGPISPAFAVSEEAAATEQSTDEQSADEEATATTDATEDVSTPAAGPITLDATNQLAQVDTRSLRVRTDPNTNADVVWGVRQGEFYPVVDQSEDGAWLALAVPELDSVGWVSSEFVIISEDLSLIPTLGSATVITSDGDRLRVRRAPTTDAELADFLLEGENYEVVATTEDGAWALLNLATENNAPIPGPSWVATEFVEIQAPQ